jgi:hypothetical protein
MANKETASAVADTLDALAARISPDRERIKRQAAIKLRLQETTAVLDVRKKHRETVEAELAAHGEARKALADDPAAIREYLNDGEVLRLRVEMALDKEAQAQAEVEPLRVELEAAVAEARLERLLESQRDLLSRFSETYAAATAQLFNLLSEAREIEGELNKCAAGSGPAGGRERITLKCRFADLHSPVTLRIQLLGYRGDVVWQGGQFSDGVSEL